MSLGNRKCDASTSVTVHSVNAASTSLRLALGLIRFGGYLPKGEYDVDHDGDEGQAVAAELHG